MCTSSGVGRSLGRSAAGQRVAPTVQSSVNMTCTMLAMGFVCSSDRIDRLRWCAFPTRLAPQMPRTRAAASRGRPRKPSAASVTGACWSRSTSRTATTSKFRHARRLLRRDNKLVLKFLVSCGGRNLVVGVWLLFCALSNERTNERVLLCGVRWVSRLSCPRSTTRVAFYILLGKECILYVVLVFVLCPRFRLA